jgi:hypothetical protein
VKLSAEASELFADAVFQLAVVYETSSSERILQGAINMEVEEC